MNLMKYAVVLLLICVTTIARAGTHHYYYTDPQGTVLAKADAGGTIVATYDYAPYGTAVASMSPAPNGPGYTGHVNDPDTGLVYMQARYYDPSTGRFLSVDPVGPAAGNVFNFNRYAYASNNPIVNMDPDGRQSVGEMIDSGAEGCGSVSCAGWAVLSAAWKITGAEGVSQVADKGWSGSTTGDKVNAAVAVAGVIPVGRIASVVGKVAEGAEAAVDASHVVYQGVDKTTGAVRYVGITSRSVETRSAEHIAAGGGKENLVYKVIKGQENLTKGQARAAEQKLINQYGLGKNGGQLLNKINSISPKYWHINGIAQ